MRHPSMIRNATIAFVLALGGIAAHAEGDVYSRLMTMKELKANEAGMVTKEAFLEMVGKLWDAKASEMKAKSGMLSPAQLAELQKVLGRTIGQ